MNKLAVLPAVLIVVAAALVTEPLAAQKNPRGTRSRVPPSGGPRSALPDPGSFERRPVIAAHTGPIPLPSPNRQWVRAETPHFILFAATGENAVHAVAHDLEKLTALLTRTSPYFRLPAERTRIFLFAERHNVQPYFDAVAGARVDASGITLRHPKGSTTLVDTSARGGGGLTPRHELVHDLIRRGERMLPLWIDEGLAEYFSNAGLPVREHVSRLRGRLRMPLRRMFATRPEDPQAWTFDFYAQSWATVATLMRRDRAAFRELLTDVDQGRDTAEAIEARYGMSLPELEFAMRKAGAPATSLLIESAPPVSLEVKPLAYPDLLVELGELLARVKGRETDAERHFLAALDQDGANAAAHLAYAELLLSMPERIVDARVQAQTALDHDAATETRAQAVIGLSYVAANDALTARPYLERAYARAPDRLDVSFPLFSLYVDTGERDLAESIFARLVDSPRGYDARKLLLQTDLDRADTLAREGRLREAAKILRDLAPKMPAKTKADLDVEAVRLESMAAGNN